MTGPNDDKQSCTAAPAGDHAAAKDDVEANALAERIRSERQYVGLSQAQVADALGLPRAAISAVETGRRRVASVELLKLSTLFGTSVDRLLGRQEFVEDSTVNALFRATKGLDEGDRQQVLRFAEFLNQAGPAPKISMPGSDETQTT